MSDRAARASTETPPAVMQESSSSRGVDGSTDTTATRDEQALAADEPVYPAATQTGDDDAPQRWRDFGFLPIPRRLRWDAARPPAFGYPQMLVFSFCSAWSVANLYLAQPILIVIAEQFKVSYQKTTNIPTLLQASYAVGLVFVCPLGDLVRRRQLILLMIFCGATLSLILALVNDIIAFQVISALLGIVSVPGQIMIPLAADLSPPEKRANAIGTILGGILLGILLARVLAGAIAEAGGVRDVYFMAFGAQCMTFSLMFCITPDYPPKAPGLGYWNILKTMAKFAVTEPLLIQGCLISLAASAVFSAFWVTSTFILGDGYGYNSAQIGLFGLVGMVGVISAMLIGRVIDKMVPWVSALIGLILITISMALYTGAVTKSVAVIVVLIILLDIGQQMQQVSISAKIFGISAEGRARISAVYITCIFLGQIIGTGSGSKMYLEHGGYRSSGGLCLGFLGFSVLVLFARGPHCPNSRWFGWEGGARLTKVPPSTSTSSDTTDIEKGGPTKDVVTSES